MWQRYEHNTFCRAISKSLDVVFHSMSSSKSKPGFMFSIELHMYISFPSVLRTDDGLLWWYLP